MHGVARLVQQDDGEPLTSETSRTPLPNPAGTVGAALGGGGSARPKVPGLPEAFRFHDLRHYLASLLIGSGLDVKVVQHGLGHGCARTTLDTCGDLWPDSDESARAAVRAVLGARGDWLGTERADLQ